MPRVVYLDQNQWIELVHRGAGAETSPSLFSSLEALRHAAGRQAVRVPLSNAHVIELYKVNNREHRERIARLMVEISQGWTIAPSSYLAPREIALELASYFGFAAPPPPTPIGRGIPFAFGRSEQLHSDLGLSEDRAAVLEHVLDTPAGLFAQLVAPDDALRQAGMAAFEQAASSFALKVERARAASARYSKAVRKRSYVAELTYHLQGDIASILEPHGLSLDNFLALGKARLMAFFCAVPTLHVEMELATERDEFWNRDVDPNDMIDVAFLSVAIPYADIVVTERFWADLALRRGLGQRYQTTILSDISSLPQAL